jgi:hypothetical protein
MNKQRKVTGRHRGRIALLLLGILVMIGASTGAIYWLLGNGPPDARFERFRAVGAEVAVDAEMEQRIEAFCGDCHAVPLPDSFPRDAWHTEVRAGYEFYAKSGRRDLDPPPMAQTVAYYRREAPEHLEFPVPTESARSLGVSFETEPVGGGALNALTPAVSHLRWGKLDPEAQPLLVVSDMRCGRVEAVDLADTFAPPRLLGQLKHPCHAELCDLDNNGTTDLIVSDLGSFPPGDHDLGRVIWLSQQSDGAFVPRVIAAGLGRVADARPVDVDRDGDLDIVVAVFGMDRTGKILLLRNTADESADPAVDLTSAFQHQVIDPRPGAIHVPPHDFNGDGYLDFAAVVSQEQEQVALFINQHGDQEIQVPFHLQTLWEGPDLTFGSSGISLVDLDDDGDMDILYTNGDAFDNGFVNPRHGVQWLENDGSMSFVYHRLTDLTGAYVARAGDLDLDGDKDIIAVAWMPTNAEPANVYDSPRASVICLEQVSPQAFERHTLEQDATIHAALEMSDFDDDGDLDFVVGFHSLSRESQSPYQVMVWWNQLKRPRS